MGKRNKRDAEKKIQTRWEPTKEELQLLIMGVMNIPLNGVSLTNLGDVQKKLREIESLRKTLVNLLKEKE